jgi:hypothetical protein
VTDGRDRREQLKREAHAILADLGERAPDAEAETSAVADGRLDPGVHDALIGIERLRGDIALKASQRDLNAVKVSIERLKNWAMGAAIAVLLAFIGFLLNLLSRLLVSTVADGTPVLPVPVSTLIPAF